MQIIKSLIKLTLFICPAFAVAQSTYLDQGSKGYHFIDRLEIKQQTNTDLNFSTLKPYNRRAVVRQVEFLDSARLGYIDSLSGSDKYKSWTGLGLTSIDEYNLQSFLMNNSEWVSGPPRENFKSAKPILKAFYKTKANLLEVNNKDFFLAVNPVIQIHQAAEQLNNKSIFLNTRGITVRGLIARKIGFSTFLTDNQERGPQFFQDRVNMYRAVPGVGFYKPFKTTAFDYFDARGYITFNVTRYIDVQFGHDKNFIGNGYRSLFLSDYSSSYLFLKLNTKIWKFNYQNIFMELMPQFHKSSDTLLDRKYQTVHHLSMNVTKWLNIGVFEAITFGRKNRFDFQYLNPIIFYRYVEGSVGSPDKAKVGLDFKANVAHRFQFYGQFLLDEFVLSKLKNDRYNWVNKYGIQAGVKYIDAFEIHNLDLQFETNRIRPFVYSHFDTIANYTHYNQPLAHPLGANLQEFIAIAKYQPAPKWYIDARAIYYYQGLDSAGQNFGSSPFESYNTRPRESGFMIGSGQKVKCLNANLRLSYEWKENLYFEVAFLYRKFSIQNVVSENNTNLITAGIRWNIFKREYDY